MSPGDMINHHLDKLVRPELHAFRRPWPTFQVCGYTGLACAIVLAMSLVVYRGLSPWVMAAIVLAAVLTFFGVAFATKIITGEESLTYYHHEIAVLAVTTLLLWLLRQPVLAYLDATLLGVGAFLACGRVGCLMVGCCHGRPCRWGVCYREAHVAAGFTPYYSGVRLFPIQAVESLWVLCVVVIGSAMILAGQPPGAALAWYVVTYDVGRFSFEFVRGDSERRYLWGFSEAQWTSVLLIVVVVAAELSGALPLHIWHLGATAGMALAMVAVVCWRRRRGAAKYQLMHPHHVREVAAVLDQLSHMAGDPSGAQAGYVHLGRTSLGIQLSAGAIRSAEGDTYHYTISAHDGAMTEATARALGRLIVQLRHHTGPDELISGNQGVFHVLIKAMTASHAMEGNAHAV